MTIFYKKFLRNFLRKSASTKPQPKLGSPPGATLVVVRGDDDFLQKISAKFFKKICFNQTTTKTWIPTCVGMTIFYKKFLRNFLRKSVTC
ncbi:hypothetical protein AEM42_07780 [Betaproteobacteria bacterium UKL13-2]|nr:hypothetical protein AEM42_07780 [Betaproteobacteria bacterium UKL13-2]